MLSSRDRYQRRPFTLDRVCANTSGTQDKRNSRQEQRSGQTDHYRGKEVGQHELQCPHCGFEIGFTPLTIKAREGATTCPMCGQVPPRAVMDHTFGETLRRMAQENPPLFDHLIEKMDYRATRQRTLSWIGVLVVSTGMTLLLYLLFHYLP
jgi:hypothetical protein